MKICTEQWWNDIYKGKPKYSEEILPHCQFAHHVILNDLGSNTGLS